MSKNQEDKVLSEIFSAAGHFIVEGGELPTMRGDADQVQAIRHAAIASRRFYEALCNERSTLDTISVMLEERRAAAENFKRVLGREWRF